MLGWLGAALFAYVAVLATLYFAQGWFIYPAQRGPGADVPGFQRVTYPTSDGMELTAGYRAAALGRPTILYFHGNGADWQSSIVATDRMVPAGYGVLAAEYRGYRGNPGTPGEEGLYRDGRAAIAFLHEQGVGADRLVIIGNSIGGGVATKIASEVQPAALVLISPFASLRQLVSEKLWWAPTALLLRDTYDNEAALAEVNSPVLVMHGTADTLIPDAHGRQLAESRPGTELAIFEGIGHDLAWYPKAEERALAFIEQALAQGEQE